MKSYVLSAQSAHSECHVLEVVFRPIVSRITKYCKNLDEILSGNNLHTDGHDKWFNMEEELGGKY